MAKFSTCGWRLQGCNAGPTPRKAGLIPLELAPAPLDDAPRPRDAAPMGRNARDHGPAPAQKRLTAALSAPRAGLKGCDAALTTLGLASTGLSPQAEGPPAEHLTRAAASDAARRRPRPGDTAPTPFDPAPTRLNCASRPIDAAAMPPGFVSPGLSANGLFGRFPAHWPWPLRAGQSPRGRDKASHGDRATSLIDPLAARRPASRPQNRRDASHQRSGDIHA